MLELAYVLIENVRSPNGEKRMCECLLKLCVHVQSYAYTGAMTLFAFVYGCPRDNTHVVPQCRLLIVLIVVMSCGMVGKLHVNDVVCNTHTQSTFKCFRYDART